MEAAGAVGFGCGDNYHTIVRVASKNIFLIRYDYAATHAPSLFHDSPDPDGPVSLAMAQVGCRTLVRLRVTTGSEY